MFFLVKPRQYNEMNAEIAQIARLRHKVFSERLGWVSTKGGKEKDEYDELKPYYIGYKDAFGKLLACVRLLPTTGPYMLRGTFDSLMPHEAMPMDPKVYESSRFCVDTEYLQHTHDLSRSEISQSLFAAMIEFGIANELTGIVTVTDTKIERLTRMAGWETSRLCNPQKIGDVKTVVIIGKTDVNSLSALRRKTGIVSPQLYQPVFQVPAQSP